MILLLKVMLVDLLSRKRRVVGFILIFIVVLLCLMEVSDHTKVHRSTRCCMSRGRTFPISEYP